jgi:SAM-dependent methyltransferase
VLLVDRTRRVVNNPHYVIRGGAAGRERLRILARVVEPSTRALLARAGVGPGMACLDVGCGGGDVSFLLAGLVGDSGRIVALDMDAAEIELARGEVAALGCSTIAFHVSAAGEGPPAAAFDVVYARFLLTHLPDPAAVLAWMQAHLRPGGVCIVEDIDFRGHFCHPDDAAFRRYLERYADLVRRRGVDPDIGARLPSLLLESGFCDVQMHVVQPAGFEGEVKLIAPITLESIVEPLIAEHLATREEIEADIAALYAFAAAPRSVLSLPRIVQAWGRRPDTSGA